MLPKGLMVIVICIYTSIWIKFRKMKKQLEKMVKENEESYEPPVMQFKKNVNSFCRTKIDLVIPELNTKDSSHEFSNPF